MQAQQMVLDRSSIRTVGLSLARQDGDFSLEIDYLRAMNTKNTLGDVDLLGEDEFMNEFGEIRKKGAT